MNDQLFFNTKLLLTGQSAPAISEYTPTCRSHEMAITTFVSGLSGSMNFTLSYPSPFFPGEDVSFYTYTATGNGYLDILYTTTPIPSVKVSVDGTGQAWVAVTQQN